MEKSRYEMIRPLILDFLHKNGRATFSQIAAEVENKLKGKFTGSIDWYTISVKLDMEARGEIVRIKEKGHDWMTLPKP